MESNDKLISIVVPCYNVEKYVQNGINSILKQTYQNIEIIAVDDSSSDNTYNILKDIEKENKGKIKVYKNSENRGLSYTRNVGLENCNGAYIGFIDPDDMIDPEFYEILLEKMISEESDVCVCDMQLVNEKNEKIGEKISCCQGEINKINIVNNGLAASACNKLFKRELILKYEFLVGKINEDVATIIPCIVHAKKVSYTDEVKYYYMQRSGSIQNSKFSEKRFEMFDSIKVCFERIKEAPKFEEYKEALIYQQILLLFMFVILEIPNSKERKKYIKMFINKSNSMKIYKNKYFKEFLNTQRKIKRVYYFFAVKFLRFKCAGIIDIIVKIRKLVPKVRNKLAVLFNKIKKNNVIKSKLNLQDLIRAAKKQSLKPDNKLTISVVVPNYNYEKFLYQRIYSILNQTVKIDELILLDDCSKDNSREILDSIYDSIKDFVNVRKIYNDENSGSAFKQWSKGISEAKCDYIWIAEADDYCHKDMLFELLNTVEKEKNISIAYVDTAFMDKDGNIFLKSIKPEIDIMKTGHWDKNYINDGKNEVKNYTFLNNTIANVSSCIIKNQDYTEVYEEVAKYRQSGDWIFYINIMSKGKVAYVDKVMNYYRVHGTQITSQMDKKKHLDEIKQVHEYINKKFKLKQFNYREIEKRYEFLEEVWGLKGE